MFPLELYREQVWTPGLSPKSSMATPGRTRSSSGHRTLSTRLPMVSMSRASKSLVGAWANSCRVRGRLSLLMMAQPKSSKACSIGSISREQVGHSIVIIAHIYNAYIDFALLKMCRLSNNQMEKSRKTSVRIKPSNHTCSIGSIICNNNVSMPFDYTSCFTSSLSCNAQKVLHGMSCLQIVHRGILHCLVFYF